LKALKKLMIILWAVLVVISIPVYGANSIRIGAIAARTGNNASLGEWQRDGALLALEEINAQGGVLGKKIELILEDSQGVPALAVSALNKLIYRDNVDIIIGDCQSSPSLAMLPIIQRSGIPLLVHGTSPKVTTQGNPWVFRTRASDTVKFGSVARFIINELKLKRIAVFHDSAEYGVGGADAVLQELSTLKVKPVAREKWTPGDRDFSSQLLKIKAANPDVIILIGEMVDMGLVMKQARSMDIKVQFVGGAGIESETTYNASDKASEGVIFGSGFIASSNDPKVQKFVKAFQNKYRYIPNDFAATGYDSVYLAVKAVEKAGKTDKTALQKAFRSLTYSGVEGVFKFDKVGEGLHEVQFGVVKDGKPVGYSK
jgi:branched-chain amino acid transport system substrate-binding protein